MRHAKTERESVDGSDFTRRLTARGHKDTVIMCNQLKLHALLPDCILCSTASRTQETAEIVMHELSLPRISLHLFDELYASSPDVYFRLINRFKNKASTICIIAHNPGIHEAAYTLSDVEIPVVPTSCIIAFDYVDDAVDTPELIKDKKSEPIFYAYPSMYK